MSKNAKLLTKGTRKARVAEWLAQCIGQIMPTGEIIGERFAATKSSANTIVWELKNAGVVEMDGTIIRAVNLQYAPPAMPKRVDVGKVRKPSIADLVLDEVKRCDWEGEPMPAGRELAARWGCCRATIYSEREKLRDKGIIWQSSPGMWRLRVWPEGYVPQEGDLMTVQAGKAAVAAKGTSGKQNAVSGL